MVAQTETQSHPFKAATGFEALLSSSAGTFPQSFPLLDRNFSNASTFVTEISEAAQAMAEEQRESLRSMPEGEEAELVASEQTELSHHADKAEANGSISSRSGPSPSTGPSAAASATAAASEEGARMPNGHADSPQRAALSAKSGDGLAMQGQQDGHGAASIGKDVSRDETQGNEVPTTSTGPPSTNPTSMDGENGRATTSFDEAVELRENSTTAGDIAIALENGKTANSEHSPSTKIDLDLTHGGSEKSGSSLSVASEPFVPSAPSSQQVTPRGENVANGTASGRLNANAASFVPSFGTTAGNETPAWRPPQLQFGSLPESLTNSPLLQVHAQHNGHSGARDHSQNYTEHGSYCDDPEWRGWHGDYDSAYDGAAYTEADGSQYYQQADGSWLRYWAHPGEEGAQWSAGYDATYPGYDASAGEYYHDDSHASGRMRRSAKSGKRANDRRREGRSAWQAAVLHILESQFSYSRESLQEMLELHEGNLEVALDMLAQLEAEMDGQLPASGQDAPELNEENFPSLSSSSTTSPAMPASKGGFAKAVASPASVLPPAAAPKQPSSNGALGGNATDGQSASVPWKETGAAVSEMYGNARSVARDHARLRNMYFQEATKAFLAGQKALAKDLSAKGREQSDLMKAAHSEASQAIYRHRNPTSGRGGRSPSLIDLHGLHVKEAVAALEGEITAARRSRPKTSRDHPVRLSVLVGTGSHTKGSRTPARLPAAIEDYLQASQIAFSWPSPGLLELTV